MFVSANPTPFLAETFPSTDKDGRKSLVVVVRGTFDVGPDGICTPAEEQAPFVYADTPYGDFATTAIRAESDFVPVKPRAEVVLDAEAVAPEGETATALEVALTGPGIDKRAHVVGDRVWRRRGEEIAAPDPAPFERIPLAWHRAFGGSDLTHEDPAHHGTELRNPIGTGFRLNGDPRVLEATRLPNVEHPGQPMRAWNDRPEPVGFGPLPRNAAARVRHAGTYDQAWMDTRLPFLPADFDTRYFQSAPPDQQLDTLNAGDRFTCINMSASGRFEVLLPAFAVPVRFHIDERIVQRVPRTDTLLIEPDAARIVLLARTAFDLPRKMTRLRHVDLGPWRSAAPAAEAAPVPGAPARAV